MQRLSAINCLAQTSALLTRAEELYDLVHEENRICVPLEQVSESVVRTLLAVEDRRFFSHTGVDFRAIVRAAYVNLRARRVVQGGSTITQQLARMAVMRRSDRTLWRKFVEAVIAVLIECQFSKERILESYLNAAYFGHNIYGIELAALTFCGKPAAELDDVDAAYLIGLLKAPARYCRCCNPVSAERRTELVRRLAAPRRPDVKTCHLARGRWNPRPCWADHLPLTIGYVSEYARRWLRQKLPAHYPAERLIVHTTIDARCQLILELVCAIARRIGYVGRLACVVQDANSGAVKALLGGLDCRRHEFNAATDGCLQPGSLVKPFILLAAIENGIKLDQKYNSRPLTIRFDGAEPWSTRNFGEKYFGWITVADALVLSDNTVYVQLLLDIGVNRVRQLLNAVGIPAHNATPAVSTGALRPAVSPLQMCTAYSVFSSAGTFFPHTIVSRVVDEHGTDLWQQIPSPVNICSPGAAEAVATVLRRVNKEGTGVLSLSRMGLAAKTGTSISGGWYASFDDVYRVLTWTESDFLPARITQYPSKAVSAKSLASRIWRLLRSSSIGFSELFSLFRGVDSMSVKDIIWIEDHFQNT